MSSVCGCFGRFWCLRTRSSSAKSRRSRTYLKLTLIGNQCFLSANDHFQCTAGYKCALQVPSQGTNYSLVFTTRFLLKGVLKGNLVLLKINVYKFSIFLLCCPLGSDAAAGREQQRGEAPSGDELIKLRFHLLFWSREHFASILSGPAGSNGSRG